MSQILISKSDDHKMARSDMSFGYKHLTGIVVGERTSEAGAAWPCGCPVGFLLVLKKFPIFEPIF